MLWKSAGAGAGATLEDILRRLPETARQARRLAVLIEHAAFSDDSRMQQSISDFLAQYDGGVLV